MDQDALVLAEAMRSWNRFRSPRDFVWDVLPIIRGQESIDLILSQLPPKGRSWVVRELRTEYGPDVDLNGEWGMAAGAFVDPEEHRRRHEAFVAHALGVAIPTIRAWLAAHPDEPSG